MHGELTGVAQDVAVEVWVDGTLGIRLAGALLWTHFGVSGPVVLNASRHWLRARLEGREAQLSCNLCPGESFETLEKKWIDAKTSRPRSSVRHFLAEFVAASLADALLRRLGIPGAAPLAHLDRDARRKLVHALVAWPLPVRESRGYSYAEATAGGVSLDEVDPSSMRSRIAERLFLVGEMLDVDGRIGGFNFQWAWASGYVAGSAVARVRVR